MKFVRDTEGNFHRVDAIGSTRHANEKLADGQPREVVQCMLDDGGCFNVVPKMFETASATIIPALPGYSIWRFDPLAHKTEDQLFQTSHVIAWAIGTYNEPDPIGDWDGAVIEGEYLIRCPDGSFIEPASRRFKDQEETLKCLQDTHKRSPKPLD